jgi:hypothetical protein
MGRYWRETLLARFGPDMPLPDMLDLLVGLSTPPFVLRSQN